MTSTPASERLLQAVTSAIRRHCPVARPSKYAKRWWTADLTELRKDYTRKRNAARAKRRFGLPDDALEHEALLAKPIFHKTGRQQKKNYWLGFVADETNIWKAAKHLNPDGASSAPRIHAITTGQGLATLNTAISDELLASFFPPLPAADEGQA